MQFHYCWTPPGKILLQGSHAVLKVLEKYWISKSVFKILKKYWIWPKMYIRFWKSMEILNSKPYVCSNFVPYRWQQFCLPSEKNLTSTHGCAQTFHGCKGQLQHVFPAWIRPSLVMFTSFTGYLYKLHVLCLHASFVLARCTSFFSATQPAIAAVNLAKSRWSRPWYGVRVGSLK